MKFTLKINNILKNKEGKGTEKLASVSNLLLFISAKSPKKVKNIANYLKKNDNPKGKEMARKSYAQALFSGNNIRDILKIKDAFPNLQSKKIENI